jgi:hypothetical protein
MNSRSNPDPFWFSYAPLLAFRKRSCSLYIQFIFVLLSLVFSVTMLLGEILVCSSLLIYRDWPHHLLRRDLTSSTSPSPPLSATGASSSNSPYQSLPSMVQSIFDRVGGAAGWVVLGSLGLTLCVMLWDWIQARSIVESDSIPQAFLNSAAFRLWSIKSYAHFCLLSKINWGDNARQRLMTIVYFGMQGMGVLASKKDWLVCSFSFFVSLPPLHHRILNKFIFMC